MRDKDLTGVELSVGDSLAQLGVRIAETTIAEVKAIANEEARTISGAVDWLLRDAIHWWRFEAEERAKRDRSE